MTTDLQAAAVRAVTAVDPHNESNAQWQAIRYLRRAGFARLGMAELLAAVEWAMTQPAAVDPIRALHAEFTEAMAGGASSNDITQLLDDFLVKQGLPSVLYA